MAGLFYGYCWSEVVNAAGGEAMWSSIPPSGGESPYRPRSPVAAAFAARPIATVNTDEAPTPELQAFFVSVDTSIDETGFALSSAPAGKRHRLSSGAPAAALITPLPVHLYLKSRWKQWRRGHTLMTESCSGRTPSGSASRVRGSPTGWMVTATPLWVAPCKRRSFSKDST